MRRLPKQVILVEATRTTPLYGEDRTRYDEAVLGFFRSYLPAGPAPPAPGHISSSAPPDAFREP